MRKNLFISEGRYDSLTRIVVKDILNDWKEQFDGTENKLEFEEDYETFNSKGQPINFELYATLTIKETKGNTYKVDGGADPTAEPAYLEIRFQVDPRELPQKWEEIYMDLTDVVRHEIEHMTQQGSNVIKSKEMDDDDFVRNLINLKVLPKSEYFKLEMEVDAMLQGMYLKAKKLRKPFQEVINNYFDKVKIPKKNRKDILDLWKTRAKQLSLPLQELSSNFNKPTIQEKMKDLQQIKEFFLKEEAPLFAIDVDTVNKIYAFLKQRLGDDFTSEFATKSYFYFQLNDALKSMNEAVTTAYEAKEETYMISKSGPKSNPYYVLEKPDGSKQIDMMFSSPEEAKKYASKKNLKIYSKPGYNMNEAKSKDPVDTITMDIPLFLRMLEYSREDASEDMDLHDVTEKANALGKERGILQMDDYDEIVGDTKDSLKEIIKKTLKKKGISPKK